MKSKTLTQNEVRKRVTKTVIEVLSSLFGMSGETATKKFRAWMKEEANERDILQAIFVHQMNQNVESRVKRGKIRRRYTEQELEATLAQVRALAPEMAVALRKWLKEMPKNLPRRGGPGRTEALSTTEKREACEQVGTLHKMGKLKKWPDIFEAVAETFRSKGKKVSGRTIKRVWESRETLYVG